MLKKSNISYRTDDLVTIGHVHTEHVHTGHVHTEDGLLSEELTRIFQYVIYTGLCLGINTFGIGTNIVNIFCFVKQGMKDPVNISLLGLTVADLGCLATLFWSNIWLTPAVVEADLSFDATEMQYLTTAMMHFTFSRISGWITALITLERCLCICLPLQVKTLVTRQRVVVLLVCVFTALMASVAPMYFVNRLGLKYSAERNRTILGLVHTGDRENVEKVSFAMNNVFIPFTAFLLTFLCTITLVAKLNKSTQWRKKSTTYTIKDNISIRNKKVTKMVVMISTFFIVCFSPLSVLFIAMSLEPELSIDGKYKNTLKVIGGFGIVLESINSSGNIFVYYYMSSKYREVCQHLFHITPLIRT